MLCLVLVFYGCFSNGKDSFTPGRKHEKLCASDPELVGIRPQIHKIGAKDENFS